MATRAPVLLTASELATLTGYVRPAAQIRWLQRNGLTHYVRADGYPVVPRWVLERPGEAFRAQEPNFEAIRARH